MGGFHKRSKGCGLNVRGEEGLVNYTRGWCDCCNSVFHRVQSQYKKRSDHKAILWLGTDIYMFLPFFSFVFLGMTLRPERPASPPDTAPTRTRIQQIHIPLIIPPPASSPRQPYNPSQPVQPNTHINKLPPARQPSSPQHPGHHAVPLVPVRPVVETGEAGPPGYVRRVTVRRGSEHSSSAPVKGFAGAPGERRYSSR